MQSSVLWAAAYDRDGVYGDREADSFISLICRTNGRNGRADFPSMGLDIAVKAIEIAVSVSAA